MVFFFEVKQREQLFRFAGIILIIIIFLNWVLNVIELWECGNAFKFVYDMDFRVICVCVEYGILFLC